MKTIWTRFHSCSSTTSVSNPGFCVSAPAVAHIWVLLCQLRPLPQAAIPPYCSQHRKLKPSTHVCWDSKIQQSSWMKHLCVHVLAWHCLALRTLSFPDSCPCGTVPQAHLCITNHCSFRGSSWFTVRSSRICSTKLQLLPQQNSRHQGANKMTKCSKRTGYLWFARQSSAFYPSTRTPVFLYDLIYTFLYMNTTSENKRYLKTWLHVASDEEISFFFFFSHLTHQLGNLAMRKSF